ncbi:hypothetical protein ACFLXQ_07635 [Chloroflexota bacterium]
MLSGTPALSRVGWGRHESAHEAQCPCRLKGEFTASPTMQPPAKTEGRTVMALPCCTVTGVGARVSS